MATFRARSHVKRPRAAASSYLPTQVCAAYSFPKGVKVTPQIIAIGELGGAPPSPADIQDWATKTGLPKPRVDVAGLPGADTSSSDADGEVALDWQNAAAAWSYCTGTAAHIVLVYGPNTEQAFADIADAAVTSGASVLSWSWGAPEDAWSAAGRKAADAAFLRAGVAGCSVTAAAGDNDSGDGESGAHVDYPAASPFVVGCGGTTLTNAGEVVWNSGAGEGTGGGYSGVYARPSFQDTAAVPSAFRGVPDVAGDADPATGYEIIVGGQWQPIGGTSAVAPLWAGFLAVCNGAIQAAGGKPLGNPLSALYAAYTDFRDITSGNNGAYPANIGWDACTGLGTPIGGSLLAALTGGATPAPVPPPTPTPVPPPVTPPSPTPTPTPAPPTPQPEPPPVPTPTPHPTLTAILTFIWQTIRAEGPAAVPVVEAWLATLNLPQWELFMIDGLLENLAAAAAKQ